MASDSAPSTQIRLKLLVDTKSDKVLCAEAGKDFVDFLFNISYLPHGTVMKLLAKGSLGNIYNCIKEYGLDIMRPYISEGDILRPKIVTIRRSDGNDPKSLLNIRTSTSSALQMCNCGKNVSRTFCCKCRNRSVKYFEVLQMEDTTEEKGYVDNVIYMVMDDLSVIPKSDGCAITLVKNYHVKNVANVKVVEVWFGKDEALELLKTSMDSERVLTDVFLRNRKINTFVKLVYIVKMCLGLIIVLSLVSLVFSNLGLV